MPRESVFVRVWIGRAKRASSLLLSLVSGPPSCVHPHTRIYLSRTLSSQEFLSLLHTMPGTRPSDEEIAKMNAQQVAEANQGISARNATRQLLRQLKTKNIAIPADLRDGHGSDSEDESLIPTPVAANPLADLFDTSKLTPEQTQEFLKYMQFDEFRDQVNRYKRPASPGPKDDDPAVVMAKKFRRPHQEPVRLSLGETIALTPPPEINLLYHSGAHVSIALFLPANVKQLVANVANFTTGKANLWDHTTSSFKQVKVINASDSRLRQESSLSFPEWMSCHSAFTSWAEKVDPERQVLATFLKSHLPFCIEKASSGDWDWEYVRDFDITERTDFSSRPFIFDPAIQFTKFHVLHNQSFQNRKRTSAGSSSSARGDRYDRDRYDRGPGSSSSNSGFSSGSGFSSNSRYKDSFRARAPKMTRIDPLTVSSVAEPRTACANAMPRRPLPVNRSFARSSKASRVETVGSSSFPPGTPSARPGTHSASRFPSAGTTTEPSMSAPCAPRPTTLPSPAGKTINCLRSPITGELLPPPLPPNLISSNPEILNRICTPYDADAFEAIFREFPQLREENPHLIQKLREGFPMGIFPELTETRIFPNNPSVYEHIDFIDEYFAEEVEAGRMSGPYTAEEVEAILGGPFQCSPLSVDEKEIDGSFEYKLRMCTNLSKGDAKTPSVNSYSNKEDFPTNYDPASLVGDLVSLHSSLLPRTTSLQNLTLPHYFVCPLGTVSPLASSHALGALIFISHYFIYTLRRWVWYPSDLVSLCCAWCAGLGAPCDALGALGLVPLCCAWCAGSSDPWAVGGMCPRMTLYELYALRFAVDE
ncbi:hypothetical protein NMY22_g1729 [Coprinellus aureogranulatus]|nr:hypothetical protein NMY22_g1729 [Coprinellus aureogranulatus]